ncbi:hypothetical protein B7494_g4199 [Chlorociboria aeruginascens]|nr:hypothetical protein B7494_g4199 [Chlorociboria aeruginascens]
MDPPSEDKQWAVKYILDPLNAPEPSQETGPGSHFTSGVTRASSTSNAPAVTTSVPASTYPTPPASASPSRSTFKSNNPYSPSYRQSAFGAYNEAGPKRRSLDEPVGNGRGRRRGGSLGERFSGDMSHRPLDEIRKETKLANRAPHLKKRYMPGADTIDALDRSFGAPWHHDGPYDAVLLARNTSPLYSPVEATKETNAEAIRATPRENMADSLRKHVPLQGTAYIPPGMEGPDGKPMEYEEGADLMREPDAAGGAYKRWAELNYHPNDLKGKSEPSYTIEKALNDHKGNAHRRIMSDGGSAYEMQPGKASLGRQRSASGNHTDLVGEGKTTGNSMSYSDFEGGMHRSNTTGRKVGDTLRRKFGSLRRSKKTSS